MVALPMPSPPVRYALPDTERDANEEGELVPMPMFPEFLSIQSKGEDDPTAKNGEVMGLVKIEGVDDPMKNDPAIDDVACVDVDVKLGRLRAVYMDDVAS